MSETLGESQGVQKAETTVMAGGAVLRSQADRQAMRSGMGKKGGVNGDKPTDPSQGGGSLTQGLSTAGR
ncbi:MAG: hypothetical protein N0E48_04855 [Candidatus Thiodiazotropha endolucinida]|nr:hypothetical protein [Candidatus Thiodiazotropha taylori]MCW4342677.1 hypothetical protein [Candidatus Thiodiazotropha endolucinida]